MKKYAITVWIFLCGTLSGHALTILFGDSGPNGGDGKMMEEEQKGQDPSVEAIKYAMDLIERNALRPPSREKMVDVALLAITGLVDEHSSFFPPEDPKLALAMRGEYVGIGVVIGKDDGDVRVKVIEVVGGSPAENAGIMSGDEIVRVGGIDVGSVAEASRALQGESGTDCRLTVLRNGKAIDLTARRSIIVKSNVSVEFIGETMVLKIGSFNETLAPELEKVLIEAGKRRTKPKGVVLDLRDNLGGLVSQAQILGGAWLGAETVLFREKDRYGQTTDVATVRRYGITGRLAGIPTVVLVNGGSASASEIVAGALQDYGVAVVMGALTYGKGSEQRLFDLGAAGQMSLTVREWRTPKGRAVDGIGIRPNFVVEDAEMALIRAIEALNAL